MRALLLTIACALVGLAARPAPAQECPLPPASTAVSPAPPDVRLEGRLVYHDGIRQWFELQLRRPFCGQGSVQLVPLDQRYGPLEVLRGCGVSTYGPVDYSPTGYYSRDIYQGPKSIRSIGKCAAKPPLPHPSKAKPDGRIRAYRVDMKVDYGPGDHPVEFRVFAGRQELRPWRAYASYWLTGGLVLYGLCGEGFGVDQVFGPAQAHPGHFTKRGDSDDMAMWDPESAAQAGKRELRLGYTCVRRRVG